MAGRAGKASVRWQQLSIVLKVCSALHGKGGSMHT